jgi:MFS family permease
MSFKLFIYYCAILGGWAAFIAWLLIYVLGVDKNVDNLFKKAAIIGTLLGILLAFSIGSLDALMNAVGFQRIPRILVCIAVGLLGGLLGGFLAEFLFSKIWQSIVMRSVGWGVAGLLIGASLGIYDLVRASVRGQGAGMAIRKIINGAIGGTLGGLLGGFLFDIIGNLGDVLTGIELRQTPRAIGLVILGMCIGLLISLAHVILKEASVKVEAGFRAGRQLILNKPETTIGRAESSDIGLFGDNQIERTHARIMKKGDRYVLVDNNTPSGTFLNGERVDGPTPLRSGDAIGVGRSILRFTERAKH